MITSIQTIIDDISLSNSHIIAKKASGMDYIDSFGRFPQRHYSNIASSTMMTNVVANHQSTV